MSTIKEGQRRGGIGAADNVWPIGETKRGASVPHSLDALGVWALSWLDCDRVPRIMLSSNLMILWANRSEEHTSELQSLMRISYAVFCLKKNKHKPYVHHSYIRTVHTNNLFTNVLLVPPLQQKHHHI